MELKLLPILASAIFILTLNNCKHADIPSSQSASVVTVKQATTATSNQINRWIGTTYHYYERNQYYQLKDIYRSMVIIDSLTSIAIHNIEENQASFDLDTLNSVKRQIMRSSHSSRDRQRDWRDSMVYNFESLQPFTYKEEAILHLRLTELMMIETIGRSYTVCDDSENSSLFDIGNGKVVCFISNSKPSVYGSLDTMHIVSGWLNRKPLRPDQYHVQKSSNQTMITITLPEGIDRQYLEAGFHFTYEPGKYQSLLEDYVIFTGSIE